MQDACKKCRSIGITCVRPKNGAESASLGYPPLPLSNDTTPQAPFLSPLPTSSFEREHYRHVTDHSDEAAEASSQGQHVESGSLGQLPDRRELEDLVNLLFSTVHCEFYFVSFVSEAISLTLYKILDTYRSFINYISIAC